MILNPTISGAGVDTGDATATAADILSGKTAYGPDGKIVGQIPTVKQGRPLLEIISIGTMTARVLARVTQDTGYVIGGEVYGEMDLDTVAGATITPGTSQKTAVASGRYTAGTVYVAGDSNLISTNIRKGTSIFGVSGSYSGGEPVLEDVEIASVPRAGYVTFTTTKRISKVCSISFFVESMDLYGYYTYLFTLQSNGMLSVHAGKYNSRYAPNYFIGSGGGDLNSGEVISGSTVTYGKGTSGWVAKIPQGSSVYGTICYIPA